jgi:isoleucyl-tRNA synthetase
MDAYHITRRPALTEFVDALSNWYVRRNRERFWAPAHTGQARRALTLYECLTALARLLAPFAFTPPRICGRTRRGPDPHAQESVHLADWPEADLEAVDADLSRVMRSVREVVPLGLQVRPPASCACASRSRPPRSCWRIRRSSPLREHAALMADELNVHEVHFVAKATSTSPTR